MLTSAEVRLEAAEKELAAIRKMVEKPVIMTFMNYEITGALADVVAERQRQVHTKGYATTHDDLHTHGELARAATCYAYAGSLSDILRPNLRVETYQGSPTLTRSLWPPNWGWNWFKPKSRRADLVRAAALLLAEIERMDRTKAKP